MASRLRAAGPATRRRMSRRLLLNRVGTRLPHPFNCPLRSIIAQPRVPPIGLQPPRISTIGVRTAATVNIYRPPSGFLFNERPPRKGKRRRREDWEGYMWIYGAIMVWWFYGAMFRQIEGIEKWALKEARLRIYEDGIDLDYKVD